MIRFRLADLCSREGNLWCMSERDLSKSSETHNGRGQGVLDAVVTAVD